MAVARQNRPSVKPAWAAVGATATAQRVVAEATAQQVAAAATAK
jgi:hypothetical protein